MRKYDQREREGYGTARHSPYASYGRSDSGRWVDIDDESSNPGGKQSALEGYAVPDNNNRDDE